VLTAPVLGKHRARRLIDVIRNIEKINNVRRLRLLVPA
jgi:hypothetical protein